MRWKVLVPVLSIFASLFLTPSAEAYGPRELFLNSGGVEFLGGANRFSLAPGFNIGLFPWMQIGGSIGYQSVAFGDDSVNTTTFSIGPTFNLGGPYTTSDFIFVGFAIRKGSGTVTSETDDPGGAGLSVLYGKRIPFLGSFAYRPSVGLQMAGKTTFVLNALALSYFF